MKSGGGKYLRRLKNHQHLIQMVSTCVVLVLFPCILALIVLADHSYAELVNTYRSSYMQTSEKFSKYMATHLNCMYQSAYRLTTDSRKANSPAAQLDETVVAQHEFYLYAATRVIREYSQTNEGLFGIYYYGEDRLVTAQAAFSPQTFLRDHLKNDSSVQEVRFRSFLREDAAEISYFSPEGAQELYIGVRADIGESRRRALLLYRMDSSMIELSPLLAGDAGMMQLAIFDRELRPLLSLGEPCCELGGLSVQIRQAEREDSFSVMLQDKGEDYIACAHLDAITGFTYMIVLPFSEIVGSARQFYTTQTGMLILIVLILIAAIALLIYLSYRPVSRLVSRLSQNGADTGEFERIEETIDRMTNEISDQNAAIVDNLLAHILYGIPLSGEQMERLGIPGEYSCFFVFTLPGTAVNTGMRTQITAELLQKANVKVFITDILFRDITVFICMAQEDCADQAEQQLRAHFSAENPESALCRGVSVASPDKIRDSFESCLQRSFSEAGAAPEFSTAREPAEDATTALMRRIMAYIEQHYTDPMLSQSAVADYFQISTYSLSRLFKGKNGMGFAEYVSARRIDLAKQLLQQTQEPISAIAVKAGISNVNYFYKVFRDRTGLSPQKYRAADHTGEG